MTVHQIHLSNPNTAIITGTCPHDCPDMCSWQVAVVRATGRALDLWGHPDHPVTQGRLCTKTVPDLGQQHPHQQSAPMAFRPRCQTPPDSVPGMFGQSVPGGWHNSWDNERSYWVEESGISFLVNGPTDIYKVATGKRPMLN